MNKYTKPTISLLTLNAATAAASSCSTSTADANEIRLILESMGYDMSKAFGIYETCEEEVFFEDYCKFSSSIQVFNS